MFVVKDNAVAGRDNTVVENNIVVVGKNNIGQSKTVICFSNKLFVTNPGSRFANLLIISEGLAPNKVWANMGNKSFESLTQPESSTNSRVSADLENLLQSPVTVHKEGYTWVPQMLCV